MRVAHAVIYQTLLEVHEKGGPFSMESVSNKRARVWTSGQSVPV